MEKWRISKIRFSKYPTCHGRPSGPCQPGSCVGRCCRCSVVVRVVDAYGTSGSTPDGEVVQRPGRPTRFPVLNQDRHRHASWGALGGLQRSRLSKTIFHVTKICEKGTNTSHKTRFLPDCLENSLTLLSPWPASCTCNGGFGTIS